MLTTELSLPVNQQSTMLLQLEAFKLFYEKRERKSLIGEVKRNWKQRMLTEVEKSY